MPQILDTTEVRKLLAEVYGTPVSRQTFSAKLIPILAEVYTESGDVKRLAGGPHGYLAFTAKVVEQLAVYLQLKPHYIEHSASLYRAIVFGGEGANGN